HGERHDGAFAAQVGVELVERSYERDRDLRGESGDRDGDGDVPWPGAERLHVHDDPARGHRVAADLVEQAPARLGGFATLGVETTLPPEDDLEGGIEAHEAPQQRVDVVRPAIAEVV